MSALGDDSETSVAEIKEQVPILPPKLAQRLAKKQKNEMTPEKHIETPPLTANSSEAEKRFAIGAREFMSRHETESAIHSTPAVPIEHPKEWVSNMHGNRKHSSRRFSPGRDMRQDLDPPSLAPKSKGAATTPIVPTYEKNNPAKFSKSTPSPIKSTKSKSTSSHTYSKPKTSISASMRNDSPDHPARYVKPHPKVSSHHQPRPIESKYQVVTSDSNSTPDRYPSNLGESILLAEDIRRPRVNHHTRPIQATSARKENIVEKNSEQSKHFQHKSSVGRRTRSISPDKRHSPEAAANLQHRSISADVRLNSRGDKIRPKAEFTRMDEVQAQIDDYLAATVKRSISPERLGKTSIKYLDLQRMNHLLEGLPPSINSLLNNHVPSFPDKKEGQRRSSPGTNNRRDVTDTAEWSRLLDWLDSIRMSHYSNLFRLGGATKLSIVELLTPRDLIQMGIPKVDSLKIIKSIQEISRRTRSLTEEALSGSPSYPKRNNQQTSPPVRKLSLHPSPTAQLQLNKTPADGPIVPLLTYKPPSILYPSLGVVSVPVLLQLFDRSDMVSFMNLWLQITSNLENLNLPTDLHQNLITIDFYLRLNAAVSPFRGDASVNSRVESIREFKAYLESCCSSDFSVMATLVNSRFFAAYAGVVMVPNPKNNPAFAALFDLKWIRALRVRLLKFLEQIRWIHVPQSNQEKESKPQQQSQSVDVPETVDAPPQVKQLAPPPPPPEPPYPPPTQNHVVSQVDSMCNGIKTTQPVSKKTKAIKVRKMTATLGSGPLVIEEVQEEVTDDEDDDEMPPSTQSPLQSIKQLSASSFVPISFRRQTTLLDGLQKEGDSPTSSSSSEGDIDHGAEDYDFSNIHSNSIPTCGIGSSIEQQRTEDTVPEVQVIPSSEPAAQQEGYYDEEGNWRYYNYHGYYDPSGIWHENDINATPVDSNAPNPSMVDPTGIDEQSGIETKEIVSPDKKDDVVTDQWYSATFSPEDVKDTPTKSAVSEITSEKVPSISQFDIQEASIVSHEHDISSIHNSVSTIPPDSEAEEVISTLKVEQTPLESNSFITDNSLL